MTAQQREWRFSSSVQHPNGPSVTVDFFVPESAAWPDVREGAELAQIGANAVIGNYVRALEHEAQRRAERLAELAKQIREPF